MSLMRRCSKTACGRAAVATLTYVYAEQTAVLGPLATFAEPHTYDLCTFHAERLTAPQGWELVRLATHFDVPEQVDQDDLLAVADAVRGGSQANPLLPGFDEDEPAPRRRAAGERGGDLLPGPPEPGGRHGHLRILRDG